MSKNFRKKDLPVAQQFSKERPDEIQAVAARPGSRGTHGRSPSGTRSGRRLAARLVSLVVGLFALGVFVFSVPAYISGLREVCSGPGCGPDQLSAERTRALGEVGISVSEYATYSGGLAVISALVWFGVAAVMAWRKSGDLFVLLAALTLVLAGTFTVTGAVEVSHPALELAVRVVNNLELACFLLFLSLFPDGRFVPRWTKWVALAAVVLAVVFAVVPGAGFLGPLWFVFSGTLVGAQIHRYQRFSGAVERQQTKWVIFSLAVVVLVVFGMFLATEVLAPSSVLGTLGSLVLAPVAAATLLLIPLSIGVAILRHRLFDIDLIINRTLVYAGLTAIVVAMYVLVVGYLGALFRMEANLLFSLFATGIIAVLFQPLRERLQRGVNRLMYGQRDDPYTALSSLGQRLEAALAPEAVLPTAIQTVAEALRLPYAAVEVERSGALDTVAATGDPVRERMKDPLRLPLLYGGEKVGWLVLGLRYGEEDFSSADRRLLDDLARQIGLALHAAQLTEEAIELSKDLQRSREKLITAREEERRRLRRDLHDGLGPQLASLTMKAEAARDLLESAPEHSGALLEKITTQAQEAVTDVRRLVYGLRPPALDELGLRGALQIQAAHGELGGLRMSVEIPEDLPQLTAAVEVAAYRIVQEALTNAARHARAHTCTVRITPNLQEKVLLLEVTDDGRGIPEDRPAGVGLHSMRERAEELGGSCEIETSSTDGTRVRAILPLTHGAKEE